MLFATSLITGCHLRVGLTPTSEKAQHLFQYALAVEQNVNFEHYTPINVINWGVMFDSKFSFTNQVNFVMNFLANLCFGIVSDVSPLLPQSCCKCIGQ